MDPRCRAQAVRLARRLRALGGHDPSSAPFTGVTLGEPGASADATALHLQWPVEGAPAGWKAPAFSATTQIDPIVRPDSLATDVAALPADPAVARLPKVGTDGDTTGIEATIPLPATPGIYRVTVSLVDHRFGHQVATAGPFNLYVPGPRAWGFSLGGPREVAAGEQVRVSFGISNVGTESWAPPPSEPGSPQAGELPRNTRLVGTWVSPNADLPEDRWTATLPDVEFGPLQLAAGANQLVEQPIRLPTEVGEWHLLLRVAESHDGPSAFLGSAPGDLTFEILDPAAGVAGPSSPGT
jgi:hypothetical protein